MPFREELTFTDDYLGIEVVRFGAEKLRVVKEIDPATLELLVPCMLLQPLIENSIKHGLEPRLREEPSPCAAASESAKLIVEVEDDGVGMAEGPPHQRSAASGTGIGMQQCARAAGGPLRQQRPLRSLQPSRAGNPLTLEIPMAPETSLSAGSSAPCGRRGQHPLVILLVQRNDARGTDIVLRRLPSRASPSRRGFASSLKQFDRRLQPWQRHRRPAKSRPVTPSSINSGTPPTRGRNGRHPAGHRFQRRQPERLQLARHDHQVGHRQQFVHALLLAQELDAVLNALAAAPATPPTTGPVRRRPSAAAPASPPRRGRRPRPHRGPA